MLSRHALLLALLAASLNSADAAAQDAFLTMAGTWKGPGRIEFAEGSAEALLCRAYYTTKEGGLLNIAIRCASPSNKIELRAKVAAQGNVLTGSWEERTFNASGNVTGHAKDDEISLSIDGGGFTASMVVKHLSAQQTVVITAKGVAFTKVSLSLARERS